jgi:hypothetical protein
MTFYEELRADLLLRARNARKTESTHRDAFTFGNDGSYLAAQRSGGRGEAYEHAVLLLEQLAKKHGLIDDMGIVAK